MKKYKKKEYLQFMKLLNEDNRLESFNLRACYNIKQFHFVRMIFEKSFSNLLYFEILPEDNEGDSFLGLIVYLEKILIVYILVLVVFMIILYLNIVVSPNLNLLGIFGK